jgi:hypothetical protein
MAKHASKVAGGALALVISLVGYWAHATDGRLNRLEEAFLSFVGIQSQQNERLVRIETKVDILLDKEKKK